MKVVSLVPSHTESLHDMGFGEDVVGRTRFCIFPAPWVDAIPHVGGTKDADFDKIMALAPDLVVVDRDENPLALVEQLLAAGVDVLHSEIDEVADAADFLIVLAQRLGNARAGEEAATAIRVALASPPTETVPVWCPIWHGPWMTFNRTAYPHAMLAAAGLLNVFADRLGDKYFEVSASDVAGSGAQWTLLPTEPFPFHKREQAIDWTPLGAVGARRRVIDGEALTWFGTRTVRGLEELRSVAAQLAADS
jgi:ABC-type Fe3+-hydroxamate transport system substrate-binding protein